MSPAASTPEQMSFQKRIRFNNFDLLRLIFAGMVVLVHIYELSGHRAFAIFAHLSSTFAVRAFFVVSGFLIFLSYDRASDLQDYALKRVRRIYPAYAVVILISAFVLPLLFASPSVWFTAEWWKYLAFNAVFLNFLQPSVGGVFDGLNYGAINGALWTLKIEVLFYIAVPFLSLMFTRLGRTFVLVSVYLLSVAYVAGMEYLAQVTGSPLFAELGRQLPGQLSYFMVGAAIYYHFDFFARNMRYMLPAALAVLLIDRIMPVPLVVPLATGLLVGVLGFGRYFGKFAKHGDFSYGVYILHFPVIQSLLACDMLKDRSPMIFLLLAVTLTLAASAIMWHCWEKRFLQRF